MAMFEDNAPVTEGVWSDYSRPGLQRKVLTLTNRDAAIVVAFLATIVGIAGVRSWRITRFFLFMAFMRNTSGGSNVKDQGISSKIRPQQVLLRNSETATGAAFGFIAGTFTNHFKIRKRDTLVTMMALGHGITFIALSILTSQIVLGRTVVSQAIPDCGRWGVVARDTPSIITGLMMTLNATLDADNYVQNCYFDATRSSIFNCERLNSQSIDFSVSHDASCPFSPEVCRTNSSIAMDTGNITFSQLGINTKLSDQLYFRRRTVCAPLREDLFHVATYTSWNLSLLAEGDQIDMYRFYTGPDNTSADHIVRDDFRSIAYELTAYHYPINDTDKDRLAAPLHFRDQLRDGHHGPSIVLLSGRGITFDQQYDDPLWSVHTEVEYPNGTLHGVNLSDTPTTYRMDRSLNMLGCDERFQICAKHTGRCVPWSGLYPVTNETLLDEELRPGTTDQLDLIIPIILVSSIIPMTSIPDSIAGRDGSTALRASRYVHVGRHFFLEPEQWKTEVTYWFAMALARLQLGIYSTIQKPAGVDPNIMMNFWADTPLMMLCGRVKFFSSNHTSLSFVGVVTVIVVSACLIFISFFDLLVDFMPNKGRGLLQWTLSENFALLEGKGQLAAESSSDARRGNRAQGGGKDGTVLETQPFLPPSSETTPPLPLDNLRSIRRKPLSQSYS